MDKKRGFKRLNRILATLLTLAMIAGLLPAPVTVYAETYSGNFGVKDESGNPGSNATWSYVPDTKTLTITGTGKLAEYDWGNYTNAPFNAYRNDCEHIVIDEGITQIGSYDFYNMTKLESVYIPASLERIGTDAFAALERNSVLSTSVTIAAGSKLNSIEEYAFLRRNADIDLSGTSLTEINRAAFKSSSKVILPNTVSSVAAEGVGYSDTIYVAPNAGKGLMVNGVAVAQGEDGKYDITTSWSNYEGIISFNWVDPLDLAYASIELPDAYDGKWYAYNDGSNIPVICTVDSASGKTLDMGKDYRVSITESSSGRDVTGDVTDRGQYTLTVTGTGTEGSGCYGSVSMNFTVEDPDIELTEDVTTWNNGRIYNVSGNVAINDRVRVNGDVVLNLLKGCELTVNGGISVNMGNSLRIVGDGSLITDANPTSSNYDRFKRAGIGGDLNNSSGDITIDGGTISIKGAAYASCIGGGMYDNEITSVRDEGTSTITINGGTVTAVGDNSAGIGRGYQDDKHTYNVIINGGKVELKGDGTVRYNPGKIWCTNLTLGWTAPDNDSIKATGYAVGSLSFAQGKWLKYDDNGTVIVTPENIGQAGDKVITPYTDDACSVTFNSDGGTTIPTQIMPSGYTATRPSDPVRSGYRFKGWQLNGTAYNFDSPVTEKITLKAAWESVTPISYIDEEAKTLSNFSDYIPLESKYTTLDGGTWVVDCDLTIDHRLTVKNDVKLILTDGNTLTAPKGISVTEIDNARLSVFGQAQDTGCISVELQNEYNVPRDAAIGGEIYNYKNDCGTIEIYGGHITTNGNYKGAGIGGSLYGDGGTINIRGGQLDIDGGFYGHAIGFAESDYPENRTANISLGWRKGTDYISTYRSNDGYPDPGYFGTVTFDRQFLLEGTQIKARTNNIGGKKLVPKTNTVWGDIQDGLSEGTAITLINDVNGSEVLNLVSGNAVIDLNGKELSYTGNSDYMIMVAEGASLTIKDSGTVKGCLTGSTGGIKNDGTLVLDGVTLKNFSSNYAVYNSGSMTAENCSVTDNTGGGVYCGQNSAFVLSGKVTISENTLGTGSSAKTQNVCLSGSVITVDDTFSKDSRVGITGETGTALTSGAAGRTSLLNFTSDENKYLYRTDAGEVQLCDTAPSYCYTYERGYGAILSNYYMANAEVTIMTIQRNGYKFNGWKVTRSDGNWEVGTTFNEGDVVTGKFGDVTLTAQWTVIDYAITVSTNSTHGKITVDTGTAGVTDKAHYEDTVTLTVTPDEGYVLASLTVTKKGEPTAKTEVTGSDKEFSFNMPAYDVTVSAEFIAHVHALKYTANADVITAVCTAEGCPHEGSWTLTVHKPLHETYGDGKEPRAKVTGFIPDIPDPAVKYHGGGTVSDNAPLDAGDYAACITLGTGSDAVTARVDYTIAQKQTELIWSDTELVYNGTALKPSVSLDGVLPEDEGRVSAVVSGEKTDAGTYTATAAELSGDRAGNYKLPAVKTREFTINKAAASVSSDFLSFNRAYPCKIGGEERISLSELLPSDAGTVSYNVVAQGDITYIHDPVVTGGKLVFTVEPGIADKSGNILVTAVMDNYNDVLFTVKISLAKMKALRCQGNVTYTPDALTYGEPLSALVFGDTAEFCDSNDISVTVSGDLTWKDPDSILPAGEHKVFCIFTPYDKAYDPFSQEVNVKVGKKEITPEVVLTEGDFYAFTGSAVTPGYRVYYGESLLPEVEYDVTISDNTVPGTGKLTVSAGDKGNYSFEPVTAKFTISDKILSFGSVGDSITWTIDRDDVLTFKGTGMIPADPNDMTYRNMIRMVSGAYFPSLQIKTIVIGEGITGIDDGAFEFFHKLVSVQLPKSLEYIGYRSFWCDYSLSDVTLPESSNLKTIGEEAFSQTSVSSIALPEGLETVSSNAFVDTELEDIVIPSTVKEMGTGVFIRCTSLKRAVFSENSRIEVLPDGTFANCTSLSYISLPEGLKEIGKEAFSRCVQLERLMLPGELEKLGMSALAATGIEMIEIPSKVKVLEKELFYDCDSLKYVYFGKNIEEIKDGAFRGCNSDVKYILYSGTEDEFGNITGKEKNENFIVLCDYEKGRISGTVATPGYGEVTLSWNVYADAISYDIQRKDAKGNWETILTLDGEYCSRMTATVTGLADGSANTFRVLAFGEESSDRTLIAAGDEVFATLDIPEISGVSGNIIWKLSAIEDGWYRLTISGKGDMPDFGYGEYDHGYVIPQAGVSGQGTEDVENGMAREKINPGIGYGVIQDIGFTDLADTRPWYDHSQKIKEIVVEDGITAIGNGAFKGLGYLTEVSLPESIKRIGKGAFDSCVQLTEIKLNDGLEVIDDSAFKSTGLTGLDVPASVKVIGERAFVYCRNLERVSLMDGLISIGNHAFTDCGLTTILIPATVKEMGEGYDNSFVACDLVSIEVAKDNPSYRSIDGVLFSKDGKRLLLYPPAKDQASYSVPDGTQTIDSMAFFGSRIRNIILPEGLKTINGFAFVSTMINRMDIPESVITLGLSAFSDSYIEQLIIPEHLDIDTINYFLYRAAGVGTLCFPGSEEEWDVYENKLKNLTDDEIAARSREFFEVNYEEFAYRSEAYEAILNIFGKEFFITEYKRLTTGSGLTLLTAGEKNEITVPVSFDYRRDSKTPISPVVLMTDWIYGQEPSIPTVSGNLGGGRVTYTYSVIDEHDFSETVPVNAGKYTVKAVIEESEHYLGSIATADFEIFKADARELDDLPRSICVYDAGFDIALRDVLPYDAGEIGAFTPGEAVTLSGNTVVSDVSVSNEGVLTGLFSEAAAGDVISIPVSVTAQNYDFSFIVVITLTYKATPVYEAPVALSLVYTGVEQQLVSAGVVTVGADMEYSDAADGTYSTDIPTGKNAGDYTVYYRLPETDEVNGIAPLMIRVTIAGKPVTVKAADISKYEGDEDPELTADITGLVEGEDESLIVYELSRTSGQNPGQYVITPYGKRVQGNYVVAFEKGVFTILDKKDSGSSSSEKDAGASSSEKEAGASSSEKDAGSSSSEKEAGASSSGKEAGASSSEKEAGTSSSEKDAGSSSSGKDTGASSSGKDAGASGSEKDGSSKVKESVSESKEIVDGQEVSAFTVNNEVAVKQKVDASPYLGNHKKFVVVPKGSAKVDKKNKLITIKKPGNITITAYDKVDKKWVAVEVIHITSDQPIVKQKAINAAPAGPAIDGAANIDDGNLIPDKWVSSKPAAVSVDEKTGLITPLAKGNAVITAYYGEGKNASKVKFKVKVK